MRSASGLLAEKEQRRGLVMKEHSLDLLVVVQTAVAAATSRSNHLCCFTFHEFKLADAAWKGLTISERLTWKGLSERLTNQNPPNAIAGQECTGLGVVIIQRNQTTKLTVTIQVTTTASSVLQAEERAPELGERIADSLHLSSPNFLMNNLTLADAAARRNPIGNPGHWSIRPTLNQFLSSTRNRDARVYKISIQQNRVAHNAAQQAYRVQDASDCIFSCSGVNHDRDACPVISAVRAMNVQACTFLFVSCI